MLLTSVTDIEVLDWFRRRSILICSRQPLYPEDEWYAKANPRCPPVLSLLLLLFSEEFKQWKTVIYLDNDIIVRGPLDRLTRTTGFSAAPDLNWSISHYYNKRSPVGKELAKSYDLDQKAFNAGGFFF